MSKVYVKNGIDQNRHSTSNQKASFLSNSKTEALLNKVYALHLAYTKTEVFDSLALKAEKPFAAGKRAHRKKMYSTA